MFRRGGTDAGQEAAAYYERSLAAWRRHMRVPFVGSFVLAFAIAVPMSLYVPFGAVLAGFIVGAVYGIVSWLWSEPPDFIARWKRGAEGERRTGRVLKRLEPEWRSVHGREARYGDLDHIVVGPGGIFLLDTKNLLGTITLGDEGMTANYGFTERDSFTYTKLSIAMNAEARRLKERIRQETKLTYTIYPVVVVWGEFEAGEGRHQGVDYISGARLEGWLRSQPERLWLRDAELIRLGLESEIIVPRAQPLLPPKSA